jgi:hypothetical protein
MGVEVFVFTEEMVDVVWSQDALEPFEGISIG